MLPATPRVLLCLALLSLPASPGAAEAASGDYALKVWETDDGLPHNSINAVLQRSDGFLWIATQGGLVRFDGLQFTTLESPLIKGPKSAKVVALIEDDADTLLLAANQTGLLQLRRGTLSVHPLNTQLPANNPITNLFREAEHVFWIVFADRGAWRCAGAQVEKFPPPPNARPAFWPTSFAMDPAGTVYLARSSGIERHANGRLAFVEKTPTGAVTLATARAGGVWVATGRRLSKLDHGEFTTVANPPPWTTTLPPPVLFEDHEGALWIATGETGLVRWQNGAALPIATGHTKIVDLRGDDEGNLWIATAGGGLNRVQRTRFALVAEDKDWMQNTAGSVCEDAAGQIWFGNRKGVRRVTPGGSQLMGANQGWPKHALVVTADTAGNVWVASGPELYRTGANGAAQPVLVHDEKDGAIHSLLAARDGGLWAGGHFPSLLHVRPDGCVESVALPEGNAKHTTLALAEDADGHAWAGTEQGELFECQRGAVQAHPAAAIAGSAIRALYFDHERRLWIGTAGAGVALRHDGRLVTLTTKQGLPDDVISQMLEDDFGWLWFGSRRGIFKVRKTDLLECAAGRRATITPVSFGRADGLSGISAVGSYQPTAWKTRAGQLWFLTRKGLVKVDPAGRENEERLPRVYLDRFAIDGHAVDPADARVTSAARKIELQFVAPTFVAPERVRFRYQLEGFDSDWVDAGTQHVANYPALRPGRYVFTVNASNGNLAWNPAGATLAFDVLPMWWETWWARTAALAIMTGALVQSVRFWSHRRLLARLVRLEQEQRVDRERVRIARDLHDDLGASLTHAGMLAEELSEDWRELPDPQSHTARLAARVRAIARDLDAVVWSVSPKNDSLASLATYISHFAAEYFRATPIACRAQVAENIPAAPLSPDVRHHLFMIAKELFNNVLKHSHARSVEVTMRIAEGAFELVVRDDGRGFSVADAAQSGRNGLKNLRARAEEVGGGVDFASSGAGTTATLRFPLAAPAN